MRKSAMKKRRSIREARYLEDAPHMATAPSPEEPGIKRMEKSKRSKKGWGDEAICKR